MPMTNDLLLFKFLEFNMDRMLSWPFRDKLITVPKMQRCCPYSEGAYNFVESGHAS